MLSHEVLLFSKISNSKKLPGPWAGGDYRLTSGLTPIFRNFQINDMEIDVPRGHCIHSPMSDNCNPLKSQIQGKLSHFKNICTLKRL